MLGGQGNLSVPRWSTRVQRALALGLWAGLWQPGPPGRGSWKQSGASVGPRLELCAKALLSVVTQQCTVFPLVGLCIPPALYFSKLVKSITSRRAHTLVTFARPFILGPGSSAASLLLTLCVTVHTLLSWPHRHLPAMAHVVPTAPYCTHCLLRLLCQVHRPRTLHARGERSLPPEVSPTARIG